MIFIITPINKISYWGWYAFLINSSVTSAPMPQISSHTIMDCFSSIPEPLGSKKSGNRFRTCLKTEIDRDVFCGAVPRGENGINLGDWRGFHSWTHPDCHFFEIGSGLTRNRRWCDWGISVFIQMDRIDTLKHKIITRPLTGIYDLSF
jgi:hypothetical protein